MHVVQDGRYPFSRSSSSCAPANGPGHALPNTMRGQASCGRAIAAASLPGTAVAHLEVGQQLPAPTLLTPTVRLVVDIDASRTQVCIAYPARPHTTLLAAAVRRVCCQHTQLGACSAPAASPRRPSRQCGCDRGVAAGHLRSATAELCTRELGPGRPGACSDHSHKLRGLDEQRCAGGAPYLRLPALLRRARQ